MNNKHIKNKSKSKKCYRRKAKGTNGGKNLIISIFLDKVLLELSSGSVQFSSVAQLCLTLCDPMDYNTPGFPVHHQLPELAQTHVPWVGDAIQSSHPLSSLLLLLQSLPASGSFPMSQFFASGGQRIGVSASALLLSMNIQDWFPLGLTVLAVQGALKSLFQHLSSKALILRCSD